jgi:hypothetical protein
MRLTYGPGILGVAGLLIFAGTPFGPVHHRNDRLLDWKIAEELKKTGSREV